ncbi:MAG: NfeD family protein [Burkholderiales bacterium]
MTDYWIWWILAAVLIGAEIVTGTFYLLVVGIAFAVGGFLAVLGLALPLQLVVAGAVAVAGTMIAHRWRGRRVQPPTPPLDLGQPVRVLDWKDDGGARVSYRGTQWDAELAQSGGARAETMYIVGTRGSTLLIADRRKD